MVQLVIDLPAEVAERLKRRAAQSGRTVASEAQAVLAAVPMEPATHQCNEAFGTGLAAELVALGITPSDGIALDASLDAIRTSRSDGIHRWIDWGFDDDDEAEPGN